MKILFLTNIPSPYRVDFFNELGKHCDLTVVFEKKFSSERDENWKKFSFKNFRGCILKSISIGTDSTVSFGAIKFVKDKSFDLIVCSNFSSPTGFIAVNYMQKHNIRYLIETDGGSPKTGNGFKEKLKRKVISKAAGFFSTSNENDKYFIAYGADKNKIFRYSFTSLIKSDLRKNVVSAKEKIELRKKLGITEKFIVLSVGRFSYLNGYGKGYDVLLKAAKNLSKDIGWYIVGGKPTEEFQELKNRNNLFNVHFIDFKTKDYLKEYYMASDLFVLMTIGDVWGLVINEAMSCGLPVITTDKCIAGLELITEGENGYILQVGNDLDLSDKIQKVIFDSKKLEEMGKKSLEVVRSFTIENMVSQHIKIFKELIDKN